MGKTILFRAVVEVLGRPQEHVESTLKQYLDNLKKDARYKVMQVDIAKLKKQDDQELWMTFAEVEVKTEKLDHLTSFSFDYMPSLIEILEPAELALKDAEVSSFLNDLQAKLHQVDMVAKQLRLENDFLKKNTRNLLRNYLTILLRKGGGMTSTQLSTLTGVEQDKLEDYLDSLIDQGQVDLKKGVYFMKEKAIAKES
ncbi:TPA: hypothetical protein HA242_00230 [Candidatus Woesearchaeota archaeon]|nr:hypothetical protein [Candidatus Woesearchaeota archaeon]HIH12131.1 hypothetical protein [Candidatus Woesearchaeota archaeon]